MEKMISFYSKNDRLEGIIDLARVDSVILGDTEGTIEINVRGEIVVFTTKDEEVAQNTLDIFYDLCSGVFAKKAHQFPLAISLETGEILD